jgi:hypothetical protein
MFHDWKVVGIKHMIKAREDWDSAVRADLPYTLILYRCTSPKCLGLKTKEIAAHWKLEDITG